MHSYMLWFYLRSMLTKYGWLFIRHIAIFHPIKTIKALFKARRIKNNDFYYVSAGRSMEKPLGSDKSIVGVGFCMKPKAITCPSINDHHGCKYLETYYRNKDADMPDACKECDIRKIGLAALGSNSAFYIMTSARDILFDVFKPALDSRKLITGLFVLCKYSFRPFFIGMCASCMEGHLFAFCSGDCKDYRTWMKADRGEKIEKTELNVDTRIKIDVLLYAGQYDMNDEIEKKGNIFYPRYTHKTI